ncbi:MAG TPA: shikimate dehydrogenase [Candidatus Krumholzibacteria bacterium]|nr:shikimate dehydrogenase [Candidatus Krumholzibacteria bacterium]HPD72213.1 shikimate dehydrogenase [Candidatus Krumholzibacteria bacterium]HRY40855.1 shikimate dehydrogenase [Candidatus Krumholzibacteria bacterium]
MTIGGATRVFGLVGRPIAHSLSPRLMNDAFARLGLDAVYVAFPADPARPRELLAGLDALGVAGANVTYPLKAAVMPDLVVVAPAARAIGAVNVLSREPAGGFRGENTDGGGLVLALRQALGWEPGGCRVAIVGAGGAARAAAHGLCDAGVASVTFLARSPERAAADLASLRAALPGRPLAVVALGAGAAALADADLVVQATPIGLDGPGAALLVDPDAAPRAVGFELVYGAQPTSFAAAWRRAGRVCLDGRDLLAAQAHLTLRVWLGMAPDLADMRKIIADREIPA